MTWILNEDAALKKKLTGLKVSDTNSGTLARPVVCRYHMPETEFATATFPMIIIDRQSILPDHSREHRGNVRLQYTPESEPAWNTLVETYSTSPYNVDYPIPYNIDYAVTVFSRKEQHNMELLAQLAVQDRIPARFGYLEIPQDGTVRSLFLEGGPETEAIKDSDGKRVYRTHYVVRIPTEMSPVLAAAAAKATSIVLSIHTP